MQERRSKKRYPVDKPARLKNVIENIIDDVLLKDISGDGARVETRKFMVNDDEVTLIFEQDGKSDNLSMGGTIVWKKRKDSDMWDVGIQFNEVAIEKVEDMFKILHTPS